MKVLYIICNNKEIDEVGYNVYHNLMINYELKNHPSSNDLCEVYYLEKDNHEYIFMNTQDHVMHNTKKYLDFLNENFLDVEAAVHVNYHEGASAPDPILSCHEVGDILSGTYLKHNPKYATNLLVNMERLREEAGLDEFTCESETVHFSGVITDVDPKLLLEYPVDNIDLEIGSLSSSFNNKKAIDVITKTLFEFFNDTKEKRLNVLYLGGSHFEKTYTNAILDKEYPIYLSYQLAGVWLQQVSEEQLEKDIQLILDSSTIKYDAIVFHEKVKKIKSLLLKLGEKNDVAVFKYNALKNIANSPIKDLY